MNSSDIVGAVGFAVLPAEDEAGIHVIVLEHPLVHLLLFTESKQQLAYHSMRYLFLPYFWLFTESCGIQAKQEEGRDSEQV